MACGPSYHITTELVQILTEANGETAIVSGVPLNFLPRSARRNLIQESPSTAPSLPRSNSINLSRLNASSDFCVFS